MGPIASGLQLTVEIDGSGLPWSGDCAQTSCSASPCSISLSQDIILTPDPMSLACDIQVGGEGSLGTWTAPPSMTNAFTLTIRDPINLSGAIFDLSTKLAIKGHDSIAVTGVATVNFLTASAMLSTNGANLKNAQFKISSSASGTVEALVTVLQSTVIEKTDNADGALFAFQPFTSSTAQPKVTFYAGVQMNSTTSSPNWALISASSGQKLTIQMSGVFCKNFTASALVTTDSVDSQSVKLDIVDYSDLTMRLSKGLVTLIAGGGGSNSITIKNSSLSNLDVAVGNILPPLFVNTNSYTLQMFDSAVKGFAIKGAPALFFQSRKNNLTNVVFDVNKAAFSAGPNSITDFIYDDSIPPAVATTGFQVSLKSTDWMVGANSSVVFSDTSLSPATTVTIESELNFISGSLFGDYTCTFAPKRLYLKSDAVVYVPSCMLDLSKGVISISESITPIIYGNASTNSSLVVDAKWTYDGTIDLDNFTNLIVTPDDVNPGVYAIRAGANLKLKGAPSAIFIQWPSDLILPYNQSYLLYEADSAFARTMVSSDPTHWTIDWVPTSATSSSASFVLPAPPVVPPPPHSPVAPTPLTFGPTVTVPFTAPVDRVVPVASPSPPECLPKLTGADLLRFTCIDGKWTSNTSITQPTVEIPPQTSIVIVGNLTTSQLVLTGLQASVVVKGCISEGLKFVYVELTEEDIKRLEKEKDKKFTTLLLSIVDSPDNSTEQCASSINLADVELKIKTKESGCKKVKSQRQQSNEKKTLSALFTLDTSKCNLWWIILVSVLGGLILLGAIIFALLTAFVPAVRKAVRPYSAAKKNRARATATEFTDNP